ncbi:MAG: hypothetical protein DRP34_00215 [Thermodesulfobacteriota bacterium]|nr:MAG: hypothetical protein DRP34_00215 [Thermodesulfobacteriota bacterium]
MNIKIKNLTEYSNLFWYFLFLIFFFILVVSLIDSIKMRLKIRNIEKEVNRKVEKEIKWYEENLENYKKEMERYKKLYQNVQEKVLYYERVYKRLQLTKEKIELPKTSKELRERFEKLGYKPIN